MAVDRWERVSELARLAPTPHNTQPYRLRPLGENEAEIVLLCDRLLPVEDRGNRYVLAAFGIFAEALELAGNALGLVLEVTADPSVDPDALGLDHPPVVVGRARIGGTSAASDDAVRRLLEARRTSRLPYHPRSVPDEVQQRLRSVAERAGHGLLIESDPGKVDVLLQQNAWAIIDNLQIAPDRKEIERWTRYGPTPSHGDGLWQVPLNQPAWELKLGFRFPWLFRLPLFDRIAVRRYVRTQAGTRHVALLTGPFRTWDELVRAGRCLFALWTAMAAEGLYMHPFGSTLTNAHHARIIASRFGDERGWLIFRFGYSDPPPAAPRLVSVVTR